MDAIRIENINFYYNRNNPVLQDLNLQVPCGAIYGLLGRNGAGKSTIIKMLLRLIQPQTGTILWWGEKNPDSHIMYRIGSSLETPSFYPYLSVEEHLQMLNIIFCKGKERIDEMLQLTGLMDVKTQKCSKISTGMKQRLSIAMALFRDPDLLILDEPTNGLDPVGVVDIRNIILRIHNSGKTIILSSHILTEMDKICTHVGIIEEGRMIYQKPHSDVNGEKNLESLYLEALQRK